MDAADKVSHTTNVPAFPLPEWEGFGGESLTTRDAIESVLAGLQSSNSDQQQLATVGLALTALLLEKNRKYGSSVQNPIAVFSHLSPLDRLGVRMDDKVSRLLRGDNASDHEDSWVDLAGYLLFRLCLTSPEAGE